MLGLIRYSTIYLNKTIEKFVQTLNHAGKNHNSEKKIYTLLKLIKYRTKSRNSLLMLLEILDILRVPFLLTGQSTIKDKKNKIKKTKIALKQNTSKQQYMTLNWFFYSTRLNKKTTVITKLFNEFWYICFHNQQSASLQKKQQHYYAVKLKKTTVHYRW